MVQCHWDNYVSEHFSRTSYLQDYQNVSAVSKLSAYIFLINTAQGPKGLF